MRKRGVVKSYRTKNGCGFIKDEGGDVFVHVSNILDNDGDPADILIPGEHVEYEISPRKRGPAALRVQRLKPPLLRERSGVIQKIFSDRGYGFIKSNGGDVFFHFADVMFDSISIGLEVEYYQAQIDGRPRAFRVRRPNG